MRLKAALGAIASAMASTLIWISWGPGWTFSQDVATATAGPAQQDPAATGVEAVLAKAQAATYQATYHVTLSMPVLAEPFEPDPTSPPQRGEITATMDWAIKPPQRRFDARIESGAEHVAPGRVHPGSVPDADGRTPTFFFEGETSFMCAEAGGVPHCDEVPFDWATWAMPIIGQSPLATFAFLADLNPSVVEQIATHIAGTAQREMLGELATCLQVKPPMSLEACLSPHGVPVLIRSLEGFAALEATSYTLEVDDAVFGLPAAPGPMSVPPGALGQIPLPPGVNPEDMARCLAQTGDPARCTAELTR